MPGMSVLSGFVTANSSIFAPCEDSRLAYRDQSEAIEQFDQERMGCPLCETSNPWASPRHASRKEGDVEIGEGQLAFSGGGFENGRSSREGPPPCSCQVEPEAICPFCKHHALKDGEVCLTRAMPADLFDRLKIKTKRAAIALSDDGAPLSDDYVAVILQKWEMEELILKASLPLEYFTH